MMNFFFAIGYVSKTTNKSKTADFALLLLFVRRTIDARPFCGSNAATMKELKQRVQNGPGM